MMNHCLLLPALTATDDCVRGGPAPERTATHTGQPQFHCGEPPPAAEPNTRSNTLVTPVPTEEPPPDGVGFSDMRGSAARPSVVVPSRRRAPNARSGAAPRPPFSPPAERCTWSPRARRRSPRTPASPTQRAETPRIHLLPA